MVVSTLTCFESASNNSVQYKYLPFFYCLLSIAFAVRDKQLNLEDIEKDNLATERRTQQLPRTLQDQQLPQQYITPPQPITPPKLEYGFKPMKIQPQYTHQQQQYTTSAQQTTYLPSQQQFSIAPQYSALQQYFSYQPVQQQQQKSQKQHQQQQYVATQTQTAQRYVAPQETQQYVAPQGTQQYIQPQTQYQQLELPYITSNHLAPDTQSLQQYYNPQLLYYQPVASASSNIQAVVDPKGGIQYVMYVQPQYLHGSKAEQSQTVETLLQPQQRLYSQDYSLSNNLGGGEQQFQYIDLSQIQSQVQPQVQLQTQHQSQEQATVQSQVQIQPQVQIPAQKFVDIQYLQHMKAEEGPKYNNFVPQKFQPKSLLDSYVPSVLQVQYFKQQQQQAKANAIRQSSKSSQPVSGKSAHSAQSFQYVTFGNRPAKH